MDLKSKINYMNCCNRKDKNHLDIDYNNVNAKVIATTSSSHHHPQQQQQQQHHHNRQHHNLHNHHQIHIQNQNLHHNRFNNGNTSNNKRKRRSTTDEKDIEYENPAKRIYSSNESHSQPNSLVSSYPSPIDDIIAHEIIPAENSETRSSSDCLSTVVEYDLGTPCSSISQNDDNNENVDGGNENNVSPTATSTTTSSRSSSSLTSTTYHSSNSGSDQNDNDWHQQQRRGNLTPHDRKIKCNDGSGTDDYCSSVCVTPTSEIPMCPLPALSWANAFDVWNLMCRNDEIAAYDRNVSMLENHPGLQPRMRAILLDWLIELCEVYKLHRETYYLAVDYLDRYLAATKNVQKTHLQLIGITCLFVAAKVEEIYPPKLGEFAYVTDGACQEEDILQHELLLLKALDWDVSPVTIMGWLGVYMQLNVSNRTPSCFSQNDIHQRVTVTSNVNTFKKMNSQNEQQNRNGNENENANANIGAVYNSSSGISSSSSNSNRSSSSIKINVDNSIGSSCDDGSSFSRNNETIIDDSGVMLATPSSLVTDSKNDDAFIYPQFSGMEFVQTAQLLDLCSMDVGITNFRYSVIAAAAMSYTFSRETALRVSGYDWNTIESCAKWMEPFFSIICEESQNVFLLEQDEQVKSKYGLGHICPNIITDDSHIIQTHTTSMNMYDKLVLRCEQEFDTAKKQEASPAVGFVCPEGLLTPPASSRKPPEDDDHENDGDDDEGNEDDDDEDLHDYDHGNADDDDDDDVDDDDEGDCDDQNVNGDDINSRVNLKHSNAS